MRDGKLIKMVQKGIGDSGYRGTSVYMKHDTLFPILKASLFNLLHRLIHARSHRSRCIPPAKTGQKEVHTERTASPSHGTEFLEDYKMYSLSTCLDLLVDMSLSGNKVK